MKTNIRLDQFFLDEPLFPRKKSNKKHIWSKIWSSCSIQKLLSPSDRLCVHVWPRWRAWGLEMIKADGRHALKRSGKKKKKKKLKKKKKTSKHVDSSCFEVTKYYILIMDNNGWSTIWIKFIN